MTTVSTDLATRVNAVMEKAERLRTEQIKAQTRFEAAVADLQKLGVSSITEARERIAALESEIKELEASIMASLDAVEPQLKDF